MATPLAQLLHDVIHQPDTRAQFATAPESFLSEHGYESIDAADVREALYVLAEGSAPAEASTYQASGDAIGDHLVDGDGGIAGAVAGLTGVLTAVFGLDLAVDPAALDDVDADDTNDADDEADAFVEIDLDATGDTDGTGDDSDGGDDLGAGLRLVDPDGPDLDGADPAEDLDGFDGPAGDGLLAGLDTGIDLTDGLPELGETLRSDLPGVDDTAGTASTAADESDGWDDVI